MKIKVCGMRDPGNLHELVKLKPDYVGFIFYEGSSRFVGEIDEALLLSVSDEIKKTGVFVNAEIDDIINKIDRYKLNAVQLHGSEDAGFCKLLKGKDIEVIKAVGINDTSDFIALNRYAGSIDYFLFDTKTSQHGGSGKVFNWDLLKEYDLSIPYFLSGGLSLENLPAISEINDPRLFAIDINSRFEIEPGLKDLNKIKGALSLLNKTT